MTSSTCEDSFIHTQYIIFHSSLVVGCCLQSVVKQAQSSVSQSGSSSHHGYQTIIVCFLNLELTTYNTTYDIRRTYSRTRGTAHLRNSINRISMGPSSTFIKTMITSFLSFSKHNTHNTHNTNGVSPSMAAYSSSSARSSTALGAASVGSTQAHQDGNRSWRKSGRRHHQHGN